MALLLTAATGAGGEFQILTPAMILFKFKILDGLEPSAWFTLQRLVLYLEEVPALPLSYNICY